MPFTNSTEKSHEMEESKMKQKWIALAVFGAMLVQVAPISSMTAVALENSGYF